MSKFGDSNRLACFLLSSIRRAWEAHSLTHCIKITNYEDLERELVLNINLLILLPTASDASDYGYYANAKKPPLATNARMLKILHRSRCLPLLKSWWSFPPKTKNQKPKTKAKAKTKTGGLNIYLQKRVYV